MEYLCHQEISESKGNMPPKSPRFDVATLTDSPEEPQGVIHTGQAVQTGCWMCLRDGLEAPAENHVVYLYQGTSYCGTHLAPYLPAKEAPSE